MGLHDLLEPAIKLGGRYLFVLLRHYLLNDLEDAIDPLAGDG